MPLGGECLYAMDAYRHGMPTGNGIPIDTECPQASDAYMLWMRLGSERIYALDAFKRWMPAGNGRL